MDMVALGYSTYKEIQPTETWRPGGAKHSGASQSETHGVGDQRLVMFIAQGGVPQRPPYPQRQYAGNPMPRGPCYGCQGDHLYRDYPSRKEIVRIDAYCGECDFIPDFVPSIRQKREKHHLTWSEQYCHL